MTSAAGDGPDGFFRNCPGADIDSHSSRAQSPRAKHPREIEAVDRPVTVEIGRAGLGAGESPPEEHDGAVLGADGRIRVAVRGTRVAGAASLAAVGHSVPVRVAVGPVEDLPVVDDSVAVAVGRLLYKNLHDIPATRGETAER